VAFSDVVLTALAFLAAISGSINVIWLRYLNCHTFVKKISDHFNRALCSFESCRGQIDEVAMALVDTGSGYYHNYTMTFSLVRSPSCLCQVSLIKENPRLFQWNLWMRRGGALAILLRIGALKLTKISFEENEAYP